MKSDHRIALLVAFAAVLAPLARAEKPVSPQPVPGIPPVERAGRENIAAAIYMHRLLSMNDEQLARSRQVIEKVEKLSPEKRAELRKSLEGLRDATPAEREKIAVEMREKFGICCDEFRNKEANPGERGKSGEEARRGGHRNLLEKHWATIAPDAARAEREKFLSMPRDQKVAYVKSLREKYGLPAEPEGEGKKRPEGERERRGESKPDGEPAHPAAEDPFRPKD
jgi:hypothetical protein